MKKTNLTVITTLAAVLFLNTATAETASLNPSPAKPVNLSHTIANQCKHGCPGKHKKYVKPKFEKKHKHELNKEKNKTV